MNATNWNPNVSRDLWESIDRRLRKAGVQWDRSVDALAERASFARFIARTARRGKVAVVCESTDCDHVSGAHVSIVSAHPTVVDLAIARQYRGSEGRTRVWVDTPRRGREYVDGFVSHDYILEAFEDGHAHCVNG